MNEPRVFEVTWQRSRYEEAVSHIEASSLEEALDQARYRADASLEWIPKDVHIDHGIIQVKEI
jgi:hypothetical protein